MADVPEPVVTVWRNRIPYRCTLQYWGRKWRFRPDTAYKRLIHLRRMHVWTVHSPVNDGEIITRTSVKGWHELHHYHADGSPLILGDELPPEEARY